MAILWSGPHEPSSAWFCLSQRNPAITAFSLFSLPPVFIEAIERAVPPARPAIEDGSPFPPAAPPPLLGIALIEIAPKAFTTGTGAAFIEKLVAVVVVLVIAFKLGALIVGWSGVKVC